MEFSFTRKLGVLAFVALVPLAACDDSTSSRGDGSMSIQLTDAPSDSLNAAVVTISKIYLAGGGSDSTQERVVLMESPVTVNLLTLQNDIRSLVSQEPLPAGTYSQLRFVIDGAYISVKTSTGAKVYATAGYDQVPAGTQVAGTLKCPSCAQSGFKVLLPGGGFKVEEGEDTNLLVDFDVASSFGHSTGSGDWVMSPLLKATSVTAAAQVKTTVALNTGLTLPNLNGSATTLAQFKVRLTNAAGVYEDLALTDANADGVYEASFRYLDPAAGPYTVTLIAPTGMTVTTNTLSPVTLTAGTTATTAITVMTATAP